MKSLLELAREGAWDGIGVRLDSALYFAGTDVLGASEGFVPMIQYSPTEFKPIIDEGYFRREDIERVPVLTAFSKCLEEGVYDNWRTLRLFRKQEPSGSLVPLSPVTRGQPTIFFTAKHSTEGGGLQATAAIYAKRGCLLARSLGNVSLLSAFLPSGVDGQSLKMASRPTEDLAERWTNADLAALVANNLPFDLPFWFVPCAAAPQAGQEVTVLGHGGKVGAEWASHFLSTEADVLDARGALDEQSALRRLNDLRNTAIHEDFLTASPGSIHAFDTSTGEVVEHTCSVIPCISGGAGVVMGEPWKVMFYHLQSQRGTEHRCSYGVSVLHPVHALMYLTHVLPRLTSLPREAFKLYRRTGRRGGEQSFDDRVAATEKVLVVDLHPLILEYIHLFQAKWHQWDVLQNVLAFKRIHPS